MTMIHRITTRLFCILGMMALLYSCQTRVYVTEAPSDLAKFNKILVLAFKDVNVMSGDTTDTRCPVCGQAFNSGEVAAGAANFLTDQTIALLKQDTGYQVVFDRSAKGSLVALYSADQATAAVKRALADRGHENDAEMVLVGIVYRFRERIGKGYGIESPASVGFAMHLIRVADGHTIWSAHFDETQKSLGDDLFQLGSFLSRGGRWLTAEELAMSGLEKIFEKFPKS